MGTEVVVAGEVVLVNTKTVEVGILVELMGHRKIFLSIVPF